MQITPDVLGDLCRRIRSGMTDVGDADFLEWVFRDQAGWISPGQGLPEPSAQVFFIPEFYTAWLIGYFKVDDDNEAGLFIVEDGHNTAFSPSRVCAWRPSPGIPEWLTNEEARDATD